ncbi:NAD(P)H-binding protein [Bombilactobacillus bombi]|uniref:NAD(P)H-binding protein n=1 Tax=Bombilactobacillus bombi TaxID=1303590 RepID=UPI0015E5DFE9|nr:NAD(P)H-binding protein [Bombilactobacillus bombi]MBA1434412.1 NAD-dependent epimerase/dehydratase family protein [Bombilactobacillus bombi]
MKVIVIGAHGQIGRILMEKLQKSNHEVTAALRSSQQIQEYQAHGYQTALVDLEGDLDSLQSVLQQHEAVIFTAGSGGKTGANKTMMVDLDGAIKTIEAARVTSIQRFIMISAIGANRRELWSYGQRELSTGNYYYAAKFYADEWLQHSGLIYTITHCAS